MKLFFAILSYFWGAIPTGYIFFRLSERKDIRDFGSRSTGATNVMRLKGWIYAVPVLVLDILKGFLPAFLALTVFHDDRLALISSFMAVLGHCFPVYIRFRGGKGVAAAVGALTAIAFKPFLLSLAVFLLVIFLTRYVSLASMLAALSFPVFVFLLGGESLTIIWGIVIAALIVFKHKGNIERLRKHQERKFGEKIS